ncbi:MAG: serine/threonine-protein kinase [Gemmataceae bacterium]
MNDDRDPVDVLAEEFADRLRRGERPSVSDYAAKHPEHAEQIRVVLPAVAQMEQLKNFRKASAVVTSENLPDRLGDFHIVRELGRGGMGVVYEAVQESLGRRVALKVLASHAQLDPERRERFIREAKAAARLHHTNIVPVFGVGEQDGLPYYVMQLIPGHGLNTLINRWKDLAQGETRLQARRGDSTVVANGKAKRKSEPKPAAPQPANAPAPGDWNLIARIGLQTAQALHYAHQKGVLHRDVKPANLLLDDRGEVWVVDFGLAKLANHRGLTATGHILGTLHYLAPECLSGKADARSDVYGLGATLYELLTLAAPFDAESPAQIMKMIADANVVPPRRLNPHIPRDLETIVLKAIDRDPARRYATARAMANDLDAFLDDRPIRARRESAPERAWRWARHHPAVASLSCCTVAALMLAAGLGWSGYVKTKAALAAEAKKNDEVVAASAKLRANLSLSLAAFEKVFNAAAGDDFRPRPQFGPPPGEGHGPGGGHGPGKHDGPPGPPGGGPMFNDTADKAAVLEAVLDFYDQFAKQNATEVGLRFEAAKAHRRVAEMHAWLNRPERSAVSFRRSYDLLDGVMRERPDDLDLRFEMLQWHLTAKPAPGSEESQLIKAVELGEVFTDTPRRWTVGHAWMRLGIVREQNRNPRGAEEAYGRAVGLLMAGPDGLFRPPSVVAEQAYSRSRLAFHLAERNEIGEAKRTLEQALEDLRPVSGGGPQSRPARESVAAILRQLADVYERSGDETGAAKLRGDAQRVDFSGGPGGFPKGPGPKKGM